MQIVKTVQESGNGGHVYVPKELVGRKVVVYPVERNMGDIKSEILDILRDYMEHIKGIYIFGSYARNEQSFESDIDILIIADNKLKIKEKISQYELTAVTEEGLKRTLENNAALILPSIIEAKTILNQQLLEPYKHYKLNKKNTRWYIESTMSALELAKGALELGFDYGPVVYSLLLRIRSLLAIRCMFNNSMYSNKRLYSYLKNNGIEENKIKELHRIYLCQKNKEGIPYNEITQKDLIKLLGVANKLFWEVKQIWGKAD